jgi:CHAD domain-containing protein
MCWLGGDLVARVHGAIAVTAEIERTYEVTSAKLRLDRMPGVASVTELREEHLRAVYFDTRDLRLVSAGVTLRRREGGADAGWHLKLPAGPDTREEIRLPPGEAGEGIPDALAALVRARTRGEPLKPVAEICTTRRQYRLDGQDGRSLAMAAADQVSASLPDGRAVRPWHELEIELTGGRRRFLDRADAWLRAAGARPAAAQVKLVRVLGDSIPARAATVPERAGAAKAARAARRTSAGDAVGAYLSAQVQAITDLDPLVRLNRPDAVHRMRVAARRARAALQVFGKIVDRRSTRPLAGELAWLTGILGRVRDGEVVSARLAADLAATPAELITGPVGRRVNRHFASELPRRRSGLVRELDGARYLALLAALDELAARPPFTPAAGRPAVRALRKPVRRAAKRLERALRAVRRLPDSTSQADRDAAIHAARKAAKRARYGAEAARPALGTRAAAQAARARALQAQLGDHHDGVLARNLLRTLAERAHAAGEDSFSYGIMYCGEVTRSREIERRLTRSR